MIAIINDYCIEIVVMIRYEYNNNCCLCYLR